LLISIVNYVRRKKIDGKYHAEMSIRKGPRSVSGTYPWSFVTQIFHGVDTKTFEVITSTYPRGALGSVASLLAATSIKEILIGTTKRQKYY
jgi:hypothetical protein